MNRAPLFFARTVRCLSAYIAFGAAGFVLLTASGAAAPLSLTSRVGPTGVGPIVIGTTPAQAQAGGTHFTVGAPTPGSTCMIMRPAQPRGLNFLVEFGTIRRVEVVDAAIATTDGFRVGDPLPKLHAFYGARARLAPGKYNSREQTLTVEPRAGEDAKYRIIYALRAGIVRAIYAGVLPQVAYVEGCS